MTDVVLHLADYAVFGALLLVSLGVGVFFAFKERNQSADSYLLNNEHMNPYAAGLSIFVSMLSALTIIALPVEVYLYGNAMVWRFLGGAIGLFMVNNTFLPKLYELKLYSLFTYIQLRFKSKALTKLTLFYGLGALLFHLMALSYLTALSFSTVVNLPVWANLLLLNTVAIMYTLCGGMKAVIWTDCLQSGVMLFSLTFICIKLWSTLGAEAIFTSCKENNCDQWLDLNLSFIQRTSSWGYFSGELFYVWTRVGFGQYFMQRCIACSSLKDAKIALNFGILIALCVGAFITPMTGMAALAYFADCDPVKSGELHKSDQIMPYLASQVFKHLPGLTGLFISAAYSATLSTLSTGLNSFATVVFKTIIKRKIEPEKMIRYQRIFMFIFGYFVVAAAYVLRFLPDTVISIVFIVTGGLGTTSAFTFATGMLFPRVNRKGIIAGYICSTIPIILSLVGMFYIPRHKSTLNSTIRTTEGCDAFNGTAVVSPLVQTSVEHDEEYPFWHMFFWTTPFFQSLVGGVMFSVPAVIVSCLTEREEVDHNLVIELFQSPIYPNWLRNAFKHSKIEQNDKELENKLLEEEEKLDSRQDEILQ